MTDKERDEMNASMLELYGFSYDECLELSYKMRNVRAWSNPAPLTRLNQQAYSVKAKKQKKGADKGYKFTYRTVWSDRMTRCEYLDRLAAIDQRECGLHLCGVEHYEMTTDRWWEGTTYEAEAIRAYRAKIKQIRLQYGLSQSEVSAFMRVDGV